MFRWIVPVRLWQLATWEAALAAVAFTADRATPVKVAAAAVAGVVVLLTSVRIGGCCLSHWACTLVAFRRTRRLAARRPDWEPLRALVPDLKLREHVDRAGNRVGLAAFGDGLTTVVRLAPAARADVSTLLAVLRDAFASTSIPLAGAQLVVWTVAAPAQPGEAVTMPMRMPDLTQPPEAFALTAPMRVYWLALRYRPGLAPHATQARGGGDTGAIRAAATAALSLAVRLDESGYASTVLDRVSLGEDLAIALGAANVAQEAPAPAQEKWWSWSAAGVNHACYLPGRGLGTAELMERWVPSAALSCVSYALERSARGQVRDEMVIRLGSTTTGSRGRTPAPGSAFGGRAVPTAGRHHRYVRRTLPLAAD